jgi:hypothetical protein
MSPSAISFRLDTSGLMPREENENDKENDNEGRVARVS